MIDSSSESIPSVSLASLAYWDPSLLLSCCKKENSRNCLWTAWNRTVSEVWGSCVSKNVWTMRQRKSATFKCCPPSETWICYDLLNLQRNEFFKSRFLRAKHLSTPATFSPDTSRGTCFNPAEGSYQPKTPFDHLDETPLSAPHSVEHPAGKRRGKLYKLFYTQSLLGYLPWKNYLKSP